MEHTIPDTQTHWISQTLIVLGVLTTQTGYRYLRDAVELKSENPAISMTKALYPEIARRYHVSATAVEKAMRIAIRAAYVRGDPAQWRRFFATDCAGQILLPTNGHFVTRLGECSLEETGSHLTV